MTENVALDAVRQSVTVPLSQERAFALFVDDFSDWWPLTSHHIGERPAIQVIVEAHEGGRWYERDEAGVECDWGRVLAVDRPSRLLLGWQLSPKFEFDPDTARTTEVEVTFEASGDASTIVTLEHRGFEVHREAAATCAIGGRRGRLGPAARPLRGGGPRVTSMQGERVSLEPVGPEHVEPLREMRAARRWSAGGSPPARDGH